MSIINRKKSVRNRFAIYLFIAFLVIDLIAYFFLPAYVGGKQRFFTKRLFIEKAYYSSQLIEGGSATDKTEKLFAAMKSEMLVFLKFESEAFSNQYLKFEINQALLNSMEDDEIYTISSTPVLSIKFQLDLKESNITINMHAGLNAQSTILVMNECREYVLIFSVISLFIALALLTIFNGLFLKPMQKLTEIISKLSRGEYETELPECDSIEFLPVYENLNKVGRCLRDTQESSVNSRQQLDEQMSELRFSIEKQNEELEFKTEMILLVTDAFKHTNLDEMLNYVTTEICQRFKFHLSVLFYAEYKHYHYHSSYFRGIPLIDEKLKAELNGMMIAKGSEEFKAIDNMQPVITDSPVFHEVLDRLKLKGSFLLIPVGSDALLSVGYIGGKKEVSDEDKDRLMIFAHFLNVLINVIQNSEENRKTKDWLNDGLLCLMDVMRHLDVFNQKTLKLIALNLQNPLRNIEALVDSIHRKYASIMTPDLSDRLARIVNNAEKEMSFIKDLLKSLATRNLNEAGHDSDLKLIVTDIVKEMQEFRHDLHIDLINSEQLPIITLDEELLRQIIRNAFIFSINNSTGEYEYVRMRYIPDSVFHYLVFEYEDGEYKHENQNRGRDFYPAGSDEEMPQDLEMEIVKVLIQVVSGKTWLERNSHKLSKLWIGLNKSLTAADA